MKEGSVAALVHISGSLRSLSDSPFYFLRLNHIWQDFRLRMDLAGWVR